MTLSKETYRFRTLLEDSGRPLTDITLRRVDKTVEIKCKALWDTGSRASYITQEYIKILGLQSSSNKKATTASHAGESETSRYVVDVLMPEGLDILNLDVIEYPKNKKFGLLIGMDIISLGDFCISTSKGKSHLFFQYPSSILKLLINSLYYRLKSIK